MDTFATLTKEFFNKCELALGNSSLKAKTYELKRPYRQVPVRLDHLKYIFFCIYSWKLDAAEVYQLLTLPCANARSVYSYDDFVLTSRLGSGELAQNSMEFFC